MKISLSRSLNGVPKTQDELKNITFKNDLISQIISGVNDRLNLERISTNDEQ